MALTDQFFDIFALRILTLCLLCAIIKTQSKQRRKIYGRLCNDFGRPVLSCVANKLSIDNANMIRGELSEVLRHYKVEPAGETMIYAKVDQNNVKKSHKKHIQ